VHICCCTLKMFYLLCICRNVTETNDKIKQLQMKNATQSSYVQQFLMPLYRNALRIQRRSTTSFLDCRSWRPSWFRGGHHVTCGSCRNWRCDFRRCLMNSFNTMTVRLNSRVAAIQRRSRRRRGYLAGII